MIQKIFILIISISLAISECIQGNCKNGEGIFEYSGFRYLGEFRYGKYHGEGTMIYPHNDGSDRTEYVGEWKNSKRYGFGSLFWNNGAKYVGEWKDDERHGEGKMIYSSGTEYIGEWKDGEKHGEGKMIYSSGAEYVGEWKNNKRYGFGSYYWVDGHKYVGEFNQGREGWGIHSQENGDFKIGIWFNDELLESKDFSETINYLKRKYPKSKELKNF